MHTQSLTLFRFIAAFIVVIFHFGRDTHLAQLAPNILTSGSQMVSFFFVLSGFVMMQAYAQKKSLHKLHYWICRVARIAPAYLLALLLAALFFNKPELNNTLALGLNLTFLQAWFPPYPLSFNGPSWSLSVEMFLYLLFPFFLSAIQKTKRPPWALMAFAFSFWGLTQVALGALLSSGFYQGFPSSSFDLIHFSPPTHLASFLLGVVGWVIANNMRQPHSLKQSLFFVTVSTLCVLLALNYRPLYSSQTGFSAPLHGSFFAPFFLLFIVAVAKAHPTLTGPLRTKSMLLLGEISYGLYILQSPIHHLYNRYLMPHLQLTYDANFYVYVVCLLLASLLSYYLIEHPIKEWAKLRFNRNQAS